MGYQLRRMGKVYVAKMTPDYVTAPVLAATDAVRHASVQINADPKARVDSPERHPHPDLVYRFDRRGVFNWSLGGLLYPSGTIQTEPDPDAIFECGIGAKTVRAVNTTVEAAPAPSVNGCTVAAAGALAIGDAVLIHSTAAGDGNSGYFVRLLTNVAVNALSWAPALPAAPVAGDTVKGCVTYKLATELPSALCIAHYLPDVSKQANGAVVDSLKFTLDANEEIKWEASGPYRERLRPAQAAPGAFTTVGTNPPSGLTGYGRNGAALQEFVKATVEISNQEKLDNYIYGTSLARGFYRGGQRKITMSISELASSVETLMAQAEGATTSALLLQTGMTEGNIVAFYAPLWEPKVPDDTDGDDVTEDNYVGVCKASAAGNDAFYMALA